MLQTSSEDTGRHFDSRNERLDSWKEIAAFFRREVRTVQLWEKREGLPVKRQHHSKLGSVYANRRELERWWLGRSAMGEGVRKPVASIPPQSPGNSARDAGGSLRVVVLPFEMIHSAPERSSLRQAMSPLSDEVRDEIVLALGETNLKPIVLPAKALPTPGTGSLNLLKTIAQEFGADVLLSGTVRYAGTRARVLIQMIAGKDLRCEWSERFELEQNEIKSFPAARVAQACRQQAEQRSETCSSGYSDSHGLAQKACAIGVHFWNQRSRTSLLKALGYFKDAVAMDPQCAMAYACIADAYVTFSYNHMMSAQDAAMRSYEAVQTALRLDSKSLAVRNALINVLINCTWKWSQAERECNVMMDSGAMDGRTIQLYSTLMGSQGRHDEAIALALHAHRLNPLGVPVTSQVSLAYFYAQDYSHALSFARRSIELCPQFTMGHAMVGRIASESGDWKEALSAGHRAAEVSEYSAFTRASLAYAYAGSGDAGQAKKILKDLEEGSSDGCYPAYDVAAVHAMLNQESAALEHLSKACTARDMKTIFVNQDRRFTKLRLSPGFQQIATTEHRASWSEVLH